MNLHMTTHFAKRMVERGFTADDIVNAIKFGLRSRDLRDEKPVDIYRYKDIKLVTGAGNHVLVTVIRMKSFKKGAFPNTKGGRIAKLGRKRMLQRIQEEE